ncbi:MAG: hypothetical protein JWP63_4061 [Candidatus Solibacter sp.]|nr:hypothetical protein [Candidatus Solibacter sp.]
MSHFAGTQFLRGAMPVDIRRSGRATAVLPELVRKGSDVVVIEGGDAVSDRGGRRLPVCFPGMLERLP